MTSMSQAPFDRRATRLTAPKTSKALSRQERRNYRLRITEIRVSALDRVFYLGAARPPEQCEADKPKAPRPARRPDGMPDGHHGDAPRSTRICYLVKALPMHCVSSRLTRQSQSLNETK